MIRKRTSIERKVDRELISKGSNASKDFDETQALYIPARKRESKLISIRLPMDMLRRLRIFSEQKGDIGYQQLIRILLDEALSGMESEFPVRMEQAPRQALVTGNVSSTSSSLEAEFYEKVGEAKRF